MSGSGGGVNVTWTADTSQFDEAMKASATAAQAAFQQVGSASQASSTVVSASITEMERSLKAAQAQFVALGPAARGAIGQVIASLQEQIAAARASAVAMAEAAATTKAAMAGVGEAASANTLQGLINNMMGLDRNMLSAAQSAKVFQAALATQGVTESELALENAALMASQAKLGAQVEELSGAQFFGAFERQFPGLRSEYISAADSARVFENALAAQGSRIAPLGSEVSNLQAQFGGLGSQVRTLSGPEFFGTFERQFPGIRTQLMSAAESAKVFEAAMVDTGRASNVAGMMTAGVTREVITLGREAMTGQFSRMPGSMMVLASRIGQVTSGFLAMAAGVGVAAFAMVELLEYLNRVATAQRQIQAAGAFFNPQVNIDALTAIEAKLAELPDITHKDAAAVVSEFARMPGLTAPFLDAITTNIQVFADALGQKVPEAARTLASAFGEPTARGREFLQSINASKDALAAFDAATDAAGRRAVMLTAFEAQLARAENTQAEAAKQAAQDMGHAAQSISGLLTLEGPTIGATQALSEAVNNIKTERSVHNIEALKNAIQSLNNIEKTPGGAGGGASWAAKESEQLLELQNKVAANAKTRLGLEQATSKAAVDFWSAAAKQEGITEAQRTEALANANRARLSLMKEDLSGAAAAAHQGLMAQIAAISAQQAAVKNDFTQWRSLQEQKLSIIRGAVGEQTAIYQNALRELNAMELQHQEQATQQALRSIQTQEAVDAKALAAKKVFLDAEVAARLISHSEALNQLKAFATQQDQANLDNLNNLIKTLQEGTNQYAIAMNMRAKLTEQLVLDTTKYNALILAADAKAATGAEKAWSDAANKIGNTFENEAGQYIAGQQTIQQAAQKTVNAIVEATVTGAIKMATQWAVSQVAMATQSQITMNAVNAAQASGGTGLFALISKQIASWFGMETAKTAATTSGVAARTGAEASGVAAENSGFVIRAARWLASELGMTSATTTGTAARAAAATVAGTEADIQTRVHAVGEIEAAAGVAAANAFAATAAIPYVGPALAPAAGAAAAAQVQSYNTLVALDVGAYSIPKDMPANLHQGEMVVPATFATGLRAALGASGGSSTSSNSPLSVHYAPTINTGGGDGNANMSYGQLSQVLAASQGQLVQYVVNMMRNGNLMLPGRGITA